MLNMLTLQLQVVSVVGPPQPLSQISQPAIINHNAGTSRLRVLPRCESFIFATTSCFRSRLFLLILLNLHHQTSIIEHQSPIINIYTHIHIYKSRHVGHRGGRDSLYLYLQYVQTELCFQPHLFSLSLIQSTDQQLLLAT